MRKFAKGNDRIAENPQIRPRTLPFHRISGLGVARVKVRQQRRSQMPPCGRTHDADALRVNFILCRMRPHPADGTGGILKHGRMPVAV